LLKGRAVVIATSTGSSKSKRGIGEGTQPVPYEGTSRRPRSENRRQGEKERRLDRGKVGEESAHPANGFRNGDYIQPWKGRR